MIIIVLKEPKQYSSMDMDDSAQSAQILRRLWCRL